MTEAAARRFVRHCRGVVAVVVGALIVTAGLSGCAAVHAVNTANHVRHNVEGDRQRIDTFATTLKSGAGTPFVATYTTSGHSPATIRYAVQPPDGLDFSDAPAGSGGPSFHLIANSSGEYACEPSTGSDAAPTCEKLGKAAAASRNQILDFYTPAHWVNFLKGLSVAAGLAGGRVGTSHKTINGFSMSCVVLSGAESPGRSTLCTTAQGILGYVKVASSPTSFVITAYSTSPPASLFELPPGAKVAGSGAGS
jgi:hypothetical protein